MRTQSAPVAVRLSPFVMVSTAQDVKIAHGRALGFVKARWIWHAAQEVLLVMAG